MGKLNVETLEGQLLIASPQMTDVRFQRAVILLLHHDEDGAMGVVLNRPLPPHATEQLKELGHSVDVGDHPAHLGGPLSGSITVMHDVQSDRTRKPQGRIYVLQKQEQLDKLLAKIDDDEFRFFVGHAGWNSGQLEEEVDEGAWLSIPASPDFIFTESESDMWIAAMREVGLVFYREVLGIDGFPADAGMN